MHAIKARLGALLSLFVLALGSCASAPAFAQSVVAPQSDPAALFAQAFAALTNFRTGAVLAGMVLAVHLLVSLTKIPSISYYIAPAWRPVIAVVLGVLGGVLAALASGSPLQSALSLGVPAGIASAGGSIVLHEAAQTIKAAWAALRAGQVHGYAPPRVLIAVAALALCGCAYLHRLAVASELCLEQAKPDIVAALENIFANYPEEQWQSVADQLAPDVKCEAQSVASSIPAPASALDAGAIIDAGALAPMLRARGPSALAGSNAKWQTASAESTEARTLRRACFFIATRYGAKAQPATCAQ